MSTMKCIAKVAPERGGLAFEDRPIPEPGMGEVLIQNKATAICGTDLHIYGWDAWSQRRVKLPRIIGHEFAGEVVAVGAEGRTPSVLKRKKRRRSRDGPN